MLEAWMDAGALENTPAATISGLGTRLRTCVPNLHRQDSTRRWLADGAPLAEILAQVSASLQNLAGVPDHFAAAAKNPEQGIYKLAVAAPNAQIAQAALGAAWALVCAVARNSHFDLDARVEKLRGLVDTHCLGPSTQAIVQAAAQRGIPSLRLNDGNLVQLGYAAAQHRIWTAETERTSAIAQGIAQDKALCKRLLARCGIPVPEGREVDSPDEAWRVAQEIGFPVAVKPTDANHGRGVILDLYHEQDIRAAYPIAAREGSGVMVERFVRGAEHRLLVVGARMVAALRGEQSWITGNGVDTVRALVDAQLNADPRRGISEAFPLEPIVLEAEQSILSELQRQGLAPQSVPAQGRKVLVQRNGNVGIDVTEQVHPDIAHTAVLAARMVGLDIAGIDMVVQDITRPLAGQHAAILEVNAGPGLLMHIRPSQGQPRPIGAEIVTYLFAEDTRNGRIPIAGVMGERDGARVARLLSRLLQTAGYDTGLATPSQLFFNACPISRKSAANANLAPDLLTHCAVQAAVFESHAADILRHGLPYDRCQVGVLTDSQAAPPHAQYPIEDPPQAARILRVQVDAVLRDGTAILNAHDCVATAMAPFCAGKVIFYGTQEDVPALAQHRARGEKVVFTRAATLVLASGAQEETLSLDIPPDLGTTAAVAAAWALGVAPAVMQQKAWQRAT